MLEFYNGIACMLHKTAVDGVRRDGTARQQRGECLSVRPVQPRTAPNTFSSIYTIWKKPRSYIYIHLRKRFCYLYANMNLLFFVLTCFSFSYKRPLTKLGKILKLHQLLLATINSYNECVKLITSFNTPTTFYRAGYFKTSMNGLSVG